MEEIHAPVLLKETLHWLAPRNNGVYIDATLGLGGHSEALLAHETQVAKVFGFEWDAMAAELALKRLNVFHDRFQLVQQSYINVKDEMLRQGISAVDGVIADLGVSSLQLDRAERGFTFRADAPLDMRMNQSCGEKASELLARLSEEEMADIFYHYGEERQARRIAKFIVSERKSRSVETTGHLAEIVKNAIPLRYHPKKIHVATKVFQALRIAVNRELDNVKKLLDLASAILKPSGRICIISFHSLEDRMVKQSFRENSCLEVVTSKPVVAEDSEVASNPRARSAKLRVAERIAC